MSDDAGEDQILGAIGEIKKPSATETALQSSLAEIGVALGVTSAKPEDILTAAKAGKAPDQTVVALQAELATVTTELNTLKTEGGRCRGPVAAAGGRVGQILPARLPGQRPVCRIRAGAAAGRV